MKRALKLLVCAVLIAGVSGLLNFAITPVTYSHIFKHQWKQMYKQTDTLIMGDSLAVRSVQPSILDEKLYTFSFNTATAHQDMISTYYYLQDILSYCDTVRTIYLGLDCMNFAVGEDVEVRPIQMPLIVMGRFKTLKWRASYMGKVLTPDDGWNVLFQFRNYLDSVFSVPDTLQKKLSAAYRRYEKVDEHDYNTDKGFAYTDVRNIPGSSEAKLQSADFRKLRAEGLEWYKAILALCRDRGITVYVFQTPFTAECMAEYTAYDRYQSAVRAVAQEYGVPFCDFNDHPQRGALSDVDDFSDPVHLNYYGSCKFMEWFCAEFADVD